VALKTRNQGMAVRLKIITKNFRHSKPKQQDIIMFLDGPKTNTMDSNL
jgi:hypothetical protein